MSLRLNFHSSLRHLGFPDQSCRCKETRNQWASEKPFIAAGAQVSSFQRNVNQSLFYLFLLVCIFLLLSQGSLFWHILHWLFKDDCSHQCLTRKVTGHVHRPCRDDCEGNVGVTWPLTELPCSAKFLHRHDRLKEVLKGRVKTGRNSQTKLIPNLILFSL